ncbi:hypothetical protein E2C01_083005 [Portunus trituberculatus]|uniref:Uncharacterized protein n=1 Tax=Portunus trituberculatus TaxID=210409 RepID=A0A5B7IW16_PORTR|nr:hypothetical protein [Portunus trituberculatus]
MADRWEIALSRSNPSIPHFERGRRVGEALAVVVTAQDALRSVGCGGRGRVQAAGGHPRRLADPLTACFSALAP